tara:strand:- start:5008 stop:5448 length:441 start_codon:yes stop_codon:yes gene_type:complete
MKTEAQKKARKLYDNTPKGKMNNKINKWILSGLVCEDRDEYEFVYFTWLLNEKCENPKCIAEYTENNWKCMDHCHKTGLFRNVLCRNCNNKTKDNNTSGHNGISKNGNGWEYNIYNNKVRHSKFSKDKEWLIQYKEDYEKEHLYHI